MSTDNTQAIIDTAKEAVVPQLLELGKVYAVPTGSGEVRTIDLTGDQYAERPKRKRGTTVVRDAASFLAYFDKHGHADSEVYADRDRLTVTAVVDAHAADPTGADWCEHRATLQLRHSDAFKAWQELAGRGTVSQTRFAEFIEDRRADIREPSAADVLEIAQTFHATNKVTFKSQSMLKSGQRQLSYVESIDATAGQRGDMQIPDQLVLGLPIFDGATEADVVTARLRFRIDGDGRLALGVVLDQINDVVAAAFEAVIDQVAAGVVQPLLRGAPA